MVLLGKDNAVQSDLGSLLYDFKITSLKPTFAINQWLNVAGLSIQDTDAGLHHDYFVVMCICSHVITLLYCFPHLLLSH
jgi:hypothetical protein